jgi:O-antigen/teichoic acid export membrane protein
MLAGVLGTGIRLGANLLLLPLVLDKLSLSEFAVWTVFVALGGFANLADFGFGSTIPRIYSYLFAGAEDFDAEGLREANSSAPPNYAGISRLNATVISLFVKISLAAMTLLAVFGSILLIKPAAESGFSHRVWWTWAAFIAAIGYNLGTTHWVLALQGLNRMRDLQVTYVLGGLSYACCAALLLIGHMGLGAMVVATFVKGFVIHGRCRQIYQTVVPKPAHPARPDPLIVRKLWPNTWKFWILSIGGYCMANSSVLICSQFLGKETTASFGLTAQIGGYITNFASLWLSVKWPEIAILRTHGRLKEMAVLFARRLALVMLSVVGMALMVLLAGNALLEWKGTHTRLLTTPYLLLCLIYTTEGCFCTQFGMLALTENVVPFFKVVMFTGLGVVVSSLILTPLFGLWGLLAAPLISDLACNSWFTVRRGFQGQPLTPRQLALAALGRRV